MTSEVTLTHDDGPELAYGGRGDARPQRLSKVVGHLHRREPSLCEKKIRYADEERREKMNLIPSVTKY